MEMINRYIYAVIQRLPESQRNEIKQELQSLIRDMLEENGPADQATQKHVENVLQKLGDPSELAAKYHEQDRYLISPLTYEKYMTTLKIVVISIAIAMTGVFVIETIILPLDILKHFVEYITSTIITAAQGFVWVTIIFAFIDHRQRKNNDKTRQNKRWKPADLPKIPDKNKQIKMSEPIAGIIFAVLFLVISLYSIELLGVWRIHDGKHVVIPILNSDVFRHYIPIVWLLTALAILKESIKIIVRQRSGKLLIFHVITSVLAAMLVCIILADPSVWNPHFIQQLEAAGIISARGEEFDIVVAIWSGITKWLIAIIAISTLIDMITETIKWYRLKKSI